MNSPDYFFKFELDFVDSLHCIPMIVRFKLDTCGIKLKLTHWNLFSKEERLLLIQEACQTASEIKKYRQLLQDLVKKYTGEKAKEIQIDPQPPWQESNNIPQEIIAKAAELNLKLSQKRWSELSELQRFATVKLTRSNHENMNFVPALQEFKLI